jgi:hypothetical protein
MGTELDLGSCLAKLRRAEEHFDDVKHEVMRWGEKPGYVFALENNSDWTEHRMVARLVGPKPDLVRWSLMFGDAISNLRDSLDHMIYAIAKFQTINKPSSKIDRLSFLIVDDDLRFDEYGKRNLGPIYTDCPGVLAAVRGFQPYNRPHKIIPPILEVLRELSNANKHRLLQITIAAIVEWELDFRRPGANRATGEYWIHRGEVKDGTTVLIYRTPESAPDLNLHEAKIGIAFSMWHGFRKGDNTPGMDASPFDSLFQLMFGEVRHIINTVCLTVT